MSSKTKILERLIKGGHITVEELLILAEAEVVYNPPLSTPSNPWNPYIPNYPITEPFTTPYNPTPPYYVTCCTGNC